MKICKKSPHILICEGIFLERKVISMDLATAVSLIGAAGVISGILAAWAGYHRGVRREMKSDGQNDGELRSDIQYIKRRTDDVLLEQRDTNKSLNALSERVTRVEESAKQAHKRIDRLDDTKEIL